jgi:hypothetical protein
MPTVLDTIQRESSVGLFQRELNEALRQVTRTGREKPDAFLNLPATLRGFVAKFPVKIEGKPIDLVSHRYLLPNDGDGSENFKVTCPQESDVRHSDCVQSTQQSPIHS